MTDSIQDSILIPDIEDRGARIDKYLSQELENSCPDLTKGKDNLGKRRTWKGIRVSDITD